MILDKIENKFELKEFVKYLKSYLFKLNPDVYNYEELINIKSNNENKYLNKFYTTNNIVESINSKLNYYLPKKVLII